MRCNPAGNSVICRPSADTKPFGMGQGSGISRTPCRKCPRINFEHSQSRRNINAAPLPLSHDVNAACAWLQDIRRNGSGWLLLLRATILQMPLPSQFELGEPNMTSHCRSIGSIRVYSPLKRTFVVYRCRSPLVSVFWSIVSMIGCFIFCDIWEFENLEEALRAGQSQYQRIRRRSDQL